jgi:D-alanine-D-alanine ligase
VSVALLRERLASACAQLGRCRVAVLAGGSSAEREISLVSGRAVYDTLKGSGYTSALVAIAEHGLAVDKSLSVGLEKLAGLPGEKSHNAALAAAAVEAGIVPLLQDIQMVFTTMHGTCGEDGVWQGLLELLDVPYVSAGVKGSAIAMDKLISKRLFQQLGIPTPRYWVIRQQHNCRPEVPSEIRGLVAKPVNQGSSVGIALVENDDAGWAQIMELAGQYDPLLIEERIYGRELTAAVIGPPDLPVPLPLVEIRPQHEFYSYVAKYTKGGSNYLCPAPVNENTTWLVQQHAAAIFREFELSPYARIDCLLDEEGVPWFIEANTLPGFTNLSLLPMAAKAAGIEFAELIEMLMAIAWERYKAREER